ncbi:hypothetical protein [Demequina sediminicola]|uniref:hypothetical protein n=1 Tax=Demequina sediminicola TaxID=1095026 RepID=UPI0007837BE1|nr:hypothetical protein [Demequina sediminicola]
MMPTTNVVRQSWSRRLRTVAVVALAAVTAACTPTASEDPADPEFAVYMDELIEEASSEGASSGQIDVLEQAKTDGELSYEAAVEANRNLVSCLSEAGVEAHVTEETTNWGLTIPGYAASLDGPSDAESLVESCETAEAYWVGQVYQLQPASEEMQAAYIAKQRPIVEECLAREGAEVDPNLGDYELLLFASEYMLEHDSADCIVEAGIDGY